MEQFKTIMKGSKGFLGIVLGTFLSLQIAPTVSLAIYTNLMTPWRNAERITELEQKNREYEIRIRRLESELLHTD